MHDEDAELGTPLAAKITTALSVGGGLISALAGVQLLLATRGLMPIGLAQIVLGVVGAALGFRVGAGPRLDRNLDLALVADVVLVVVMGLWFVAAIALYNLFSLMPPFAALVLMLAIPFGVSARSAARQVAMARRRLLEGI